MNFQVDPTGFVFSPTAKWRCALGLGGIDHKHKEGDGITPLGSHPFGRIFWRSDRLSQPKTELTCLPITPDMGWCDDPDQADYNQLIKLPHDGHFENLWRDDPVYDVVVELLYNTNPIKRGQGSAIFMHVAKPDFSPTEGCIALKLEDLLSLLQEANETSRLIVDQK